jgi:predicted PurR-regulated permease PerM
MSGNTTNPTPTERTFQSLRLGLILAVFVVITWLMGHVLLQVFAGLLLAVMLHGLAAQISRHSWLSYGWAFSCVVAVIACAVAAMAYYVAPRVIAESNELLSGASLAMEHLSRQLSKALPNLKLSTEQFPSLSQLSSSFVGLGSTMTRAVVTSIIVLFVGFYAALNPSLYLRGFVRLFPPELRPRIDEILAALGHSLRWWLLGRAILMVSVGVLTLVGLRLLSIPLALTLSLIAGLLTFIPYLGAVISGIPAVLIAFLQSPLHAGYVILVYLVAHILEGYVMTPLIQQRTVHLPPALMLSAQALMGVLFGIIGAALAAPLAVVVMVIVRILYIRDALGEGEPAPDLRD